MKYYAVKVGNNPGLFDNWAECQESIKGFSGAVYKSFNSKEEAEAFLSDRDIWGEQIAADIEQGYLVAFCDGSFDKELNRYSYGVIIIGGDHTETPLCGYGSNPKYIVSNNIIGEIFGVINALDWAVSNGYEKIKIYHDYEGLSKWLSGEWNAGTDASKMYTSLYHTKFEGVIDVVFEKVKGHSNNLYNDKSDALAKSALVDRTRMAIQGDHWFVLPYFKESDFKALTELVSEAIPGVSIDKKEYGTKFVYRLEYEHKKVVVSLFKWEYPKFCVSCKAWCKIEQKYFKAGAAQAAAAFSTKITALRGDVKGGGVSLRSSRLLTFRLQPVSPACGQQRTPPTVRELRSSPAAFRSTSS